MLLIIDKEIKMTKEIELLEKVSEILSGTAQNTVAHYSQWFFADAISAVILGLVMIFAPLIFMIKRPYRGSDLWLLIDVLFSFVIIIGLSCVFNHTATLFAPEGKAIHQLINDIRG